MVLLVSQIREAKSMNNNIQPRARIIGTNVLYQLQNSSKHLVQRVPVRQACCITCISSLRLFPSVYHRRVHSWGTSGGAMHLSSDANDMLPLVLLSLALSRRRLVLRLHSNLLLPTPTLFATGALARLRATRVVILLPQQNAVKAFSSRDSHKKCGGKYLWR